MAVLGSDPKPWGYRWRSSSVFVVFCITVAVFSETFLYGFMVPILGYMITDRLHMDPFYIQHTTSAILAIHGFIAVIASPLIGHLSERFLTNRRGPLLISLIGAITGTALVAGSHSLGILFLGRILQSLSGSVVWIVGLATVADHVAEDHMAKTMGTVDSFISAGTIAGPVVSGFVFKECGYWPTWAVPLVVLALDLVARLVMIDSQHGQQVLNDPDVPNSPSTAYLAEESRSLLSDTTEGHESVAAEPLKPDTSNGPASFYRIMLKNGRVITALLTSMGITTVMVSFDATLPLHVHRTFGWNTEQTSVLFLILQLPSIFIGPLVGWLRDRVGTQIPTVIGLCALAPCLLLLGVPGDPQFPWASVDRYGPITYVITIFVIGIVIPFLGGIGVLEVTAVVKGLTAQNPQIFGPQGGQPRALSMAGVAANLAMMLGPVISGFLSEAVSYYHMNVVFCALLWFLSLMFWVFGGSRNMGPGHHL
ncbi:MFS general substrate transporter [Aspergillus pseudotamarii]|uniref:MFS general substrate transporter n=1 Tax=Aspergillus pseudotamarii TaxID=132259 RepID=A0A5N6SU78_ASPPS|nr:MFS general substrate transporter [Aspergillus pseudotamarii]KAE8137457.1 MFS general substrate transporter [Aspergillus pseudotamarii]